MSQERKNLKIVSLITLALAIVSVCAGVFLLLRTSGSYMEALVGVIVCVAMCVMGFVSGLSANKAANTPSKAKSPVPYACALIVSIAGILAGFGVGVPKADVVALVISCCMAVTSLISLVLSRTVYEKSLK